MFISSIVRTSSSVGKWSLIHSHRASLLDASGAGHKRIRPQLVCRSICSSQVSFSRMKGSGGSSSRRNEFDFEEVKAEANKEAKRVEDFVKAKANTFESARNEYKKSLEKVDEQIKTIEQKYPEISKQVFFKDVAELCMISCEYTTTRTAVRYSSRIHYMNSNGNHLKLFLILLFLLLFVVFFTLV